MAKLKSKKNIEKELQKNIQTKTDQIFLLKVFLRKIKELKEQKSQKNDTEILNQIETEF